MIIFALLVVCLLAGEINVDTSSGLFADSFGRVRVFHGVNAIFKTFPFYPDTEGYDSNNSLSDIDLYNLRSFGMNVIRLNVPWEGVEPQRGEYNYTYLEVLQSIVRRCKEFGIQVIFDCHQDLFSKKLCGEGFPDWVVQRKSFPAPLPIKMRFDQKGYPLREDCLKVEFGLFYTTFDIMRIQQDFVTGKGGYDERFALMWGLVAKYMAGETNVLGYEILNEPQGTDVWRNPANTLLPGVSNNKFLLPFYKKVYKEIRKHDKDTMIFFEPCVGDLLSGGFLETPGGESQLHKQVFSYHSYCPSVDKQGEPTSAAVCKIFDYLEVQSKVINAKHLKCGMMLTEFGALSNSNESVAEVTRVTRDAERNFNSWVYWQFKYYNDITTAARPGSIESFYHENGSLQTNKVKALSHPYFEAICGTPLKTSWTTTSVELLFVPGDCSPKHTEVFVNEVFYFPLGVKLQTSPECRACALEKVAPGRFQLLVPRSMQGRRLRVTITGR